MSARAWRIIDWAIPVVTASALTYAPQLIDTLKARGGWWAIGASVAVIAGRAAYQWYGTRPKPYG
jgi:uncharacterized membrane protein YdfJ with MMPL/SSD domain